MTHFDLNEGISVIIPFFNEGSNTEKAVQFVLMAAKKVSFPVEIIVVNDGSSDGISSDNFPKPVRYLEIQHVGRLNARHFGLLAAKYDAILFLDARVWVHGSILLKIHELTIENPDSRFWNGYVISQSKSAYASIWESLVRVGWKPIESGVTIRFGKNDFDKYPKGTGMFLAPKADWLEAFEETINEKMKYLEISDDTRILRRFTEKSEIWISDEFSADYIPRTNLQSYVKNGFYRGNTFVDSYWESATIFGKLVKFSVPVGITSQLMLGVKAGIQYLVIFDALVFISILVSFYFFSFTKWRNRKRALRETWVLIPLLFSFGLGFLKAYVAGLPVRLLRKSRR